ncbi:MAG: ABC transporter permease [Chloroflexi bacterium]|nr:ABC transporter permease [Chloroflexota bacterium]
MAESLQQTTVPQLATPHAERRTRPRWQQNLFALLYDPVTLISLIVLTAVIVMAVAAPVLTPHDPELQSLRLRTRPPFWLMNNEPGYPLGTDALGRDILSRIIFGARVSMLVGIGAVIIQGTIGVLVGLMAGFFGGWIDTVLMRLADIQQAIPFLILAVAVAAVVDQSLLNVIIVLGVAGWVPYGRVVRAEVLSVREREFVTAARALGSSNLRLIFTHILPNVAASITVISTLTISTMILAEASLSFLGLGVPPSTPTWGGMVAAGRDYLATAAWVSIIPGIAIFLTVLSINLLGDKLRALLDPTL